MEGSSSAIYVVGAHLTTVNIFSFCMYILSFVNNCSWSFVVNIFADMFHLS